MAKWPPMPSLRDFGDFIGREIRVLARPASNCHGSAAQEDESLKLHYATLIESARGAGYAGGSS
jgi:hypothetical protein